MSGASTDTPVPRSSSTVFWTTPATSMTFIRGLIEVAGGDGTDILATAGAVAADGSASGITGFETRISDLGNSIGLNINSIITILQNDIDKREFDKDFYKNFPNKIYILKKNIDRKEGLKIFKIKEKENLIDLYETYNNEDYKIVQEYEKNQYLYQNKIVILRVYLLIVRQGNSLKFIKQKWIKCLYSKYDYNLKNIKSMISDSTFNSPNFPKNLKELFMDNDIIYNNINQQINDIFFKIKNASKDLLTNNNILNNCVLFQLYGCDFVIDNNLNVRLLEINKNPNLINNFNKEEENIKKNMINDIYSYIKKL